MPGQSRTLTPSIHHMNARAVNTDPQHTPHEYPDSQHRPQHTPHNARTVSTDHTYTTRMPGQSRALTTSIHHRMPGQSALTPSIHHRMPGQSRALQRAGGIWRGQLV
ncbi:hypothetical protein ACOMHN_020372 [Nucella lapillus]